MEVFSYHAEGNVLAVDVSANHRYVHIKQSFNRHFPAVAGILDEESRQFAPETLGTF